MRKILFFLMFLCAAISVNAWEYDSPINFQTNLVQNDIDGYSMGPVFFNMTLIINSTIAASPCGTEPMASFYDAHRVEMKLTLDTSCNNSNITIAYSPRPTIRLFSRSLDGRYKGYNLTLVQGGNFDYFEDDIVSNNRTFIKYDYVTASGGYFCIIKPALGDINPPLYLQISRGLNKSFMKDGFGLVTKKNVNVDDFQNIIYDDYQNIFQVDDPNYYVDYGCYLPPIIPTGPQIYNFMLNPNTVDIGDYTSLDNYIIKGSNELDKLTINIRGLTNITMGYTPIVGENLVSFDTTGLTDGYYNMSLTINDTIGLSFTTSDLVLTVGSPTSTTSTTTTTNPAARSCAYFKNTITHAPLTEVVDAITMEDEYIPDLDYDISIENSTDGVKHYCINHNDNSGRYVYVIADKSGYNHYERSNLFFKGQIYELDLIPNGDYIDNSTNSTNRTVINSTKYGINGYLLYNGSTLKGRIVVIQTGNNLLVHSNNGGYWEYGKIFLSGENVCFTVSDSDYSGSTCTQFINESINGLNISLVKISDDRDDNSSGRDLVDITIHVKTPSVIGGSYDNVPNADVLYTRNGYSDKWDCVTDASGECEIIDILYNVSYRIGIKADGYEDGGFNRRVTSYYEEYTLDRQSARGCTIQGDISIKNGTAYLSNLGNIPVEIKKNGAIIKTVYTNVAGHYSASVECGGASYDVSAKYGTYTVVKSGTVGNEGGSITINLEINITDEDWSNIWNNFKTLLKALSAIFFLIIVILFFSLLMYALRSLNHH